MEYSKLYEHYYSGYYNKFQEKIKKNFIAQKIKKISFQESFNLIIDYLDFEIPKRTLVNNDSELILLLKKFRDRYSIFEEDETEEVLKNVIEELFEKLNIQSQKRNYNFNDFIREIALLEVAHEIRRLLSNNYRLFELIYKTRMFDEFEIKEYRSISLEQTDLYIKLNKIVNPKQYQNESQEEERVTFLNTEKENNTKALTLPVNKLNDNEKSFLFHIMCKTINKEPDKNDSKNFEFNLPNTELLRLNSLIDFYDEKVFTDSYRDSNHYKILSKGINYFEEKNKLFFLQNLIAKIAEYKLTETTKHIQEIVSTISHKSILKNRTAK